MNAEFFSSNAPWIEPLILWYFTAVNGVYFFFLVLGSFKIYFRQKELSAEDVTSVLRSNTLPEITFIVPMYNEEAQIVSNLKNLLSLTYRYKRVIAVNDGSEDHTLDEVKSAFQLVEVPKFYDDRIPSQAVRAVYYSSLHPELLVIDKEHGRKYDTLNAGINAVATPFLIAVDADTVIDDAAFEALVRPILTDPNTIAVGTSIRIRNGCVVGYNNISLVRFPNNFWAALQSSEYLRSFLGRMGWDLFNGNFVVAGAFSVFSKECLIEAGGFSPSVAEDMEIIIRLHRVMKASHKKYRIAYFPDPVAWTEGPTTLRKLGKQRVRWHLGLLESLWYHKRLFLNPFYGMAGLFNYPFWIFAEAIEPWIELVAFGYVVGAWYYYMLNESFLILLLGVSFGVTFVFTIFCLFIEDFSFKRYQTFRNVFLLFVSSLVENLGYRQITVFWRVYSFFKFFWKLPQIHRDSKWVQSVSRKFKTPKAWSS